MNFFLVTGARPNFLKIAAIMDAFTKRRAISNGFFHRLVHTGQHYDRKMSADFFIDLGIPESDSNLAVCSGSHARQTARVMVAFEKRCLAGTDPERIREAICLVVKGNPTPRRIPDKWDGHAAERIVARLLNEHSVSC